jgi:hypothetical protein
VIVTAYLAWYDEPVEQLDACIRAMPVVADKLVALDGGYVRYPGAKPASPRAQTAAIKTAAADAGLDCQVVVPKRLWSGQLEKRSRLLNLAAEGSDWIVGVDADHILHGVRYSVRHELEQLSDSAAVDVDFYTPMNYDRPIADSAAGDWHKNLAGTWSVITGLFRAYPDWRVERYHWWYSADRGGNRVWMWGGDGSYPHVKVHRMQAPYFVEHQCLFREEKQILANRDFCQDRALIVRETGQEDAVAAGLVTA